MGIVVNVANLCDSCIAWNTGLRLVIGLGKPFNDKGSIYFVTSPKKSCSCNLMGTPEQPTAPPRKLGFAARQKISRVQLGVRRDSFTHLFPPSYEFSMMGFYYQVS